MKGLIRLLLWIGICYCCFLDLTKGATAAAAASKNPLGNLFRRNKKASPPSPPPSLTLETLSDKAAHIREESLKKIQQSRLALQVEARRITREINNIARQKGTTLRDTALKEAETRRWQVEQEMMRLTHEMEDLTREKAVQAELAAKQRLDELEQTIKDETQRLADGVEYVAKQKANQVGAFVTQQLAVIEKRVADRVTTFVDRLLYGKPLEEKKLLPDAVSEYFLKALRLLVILSCIGNLWGPEPIPNLWAVATTAGEGAGGGASGNDMSIDRRTLAGALDLAGFVLLIPKASHKTQMYGAALIALIFGRGCLLSYYDSSSTSGAVDLWEMLFSGMVAALASTLLVNEFVTILEKQESKKRKRKMLIPGAVATLVVTLIVSEVLMMSSGSDEEEKSKR